MLPGTWEANVNLFSIYAMETVVGLDRSVAWHGRMFAIFAVGYIACIECPLSSCGFFLPYGWPRAED